MPAIRSVLAPVVLVASFMLPACQPEATGGGEQEAARSAAETAVREIRQLDREWIQMVEAKDTSGIVDLYVEGAGRIMPPESPAGVGREALRQFWSAAVNFPHLTFEPDTIVASEAGDLAADIGSVTFRPPGADANVRGKYIVVWVRQDGEWKILADIFNTDGAPEEGN